MVGYDGKKNQAYFDAVYKNAVDLCVKLCKEYNIDTDNIICHSEAYKQGIASNHSDVMHWFPKHGKTMDDFRQAVEDQLYVVPVKTITKDSSKDDIKWLQHKLNKVLKGSISFVPLAVDGDYGNRTRQAVLSYWEALGWNKLGLDNGTKAGKKTIAVLKENRVK
jgi:N-acetylmuramoyl-L-alanine amidase